MTLNILRFIQTLQNFIKVFVGNDVYNLSKYDEIQIWDTTKIKYPNTGGFLLQNWVIKCNDKNVNGKIQVFHKSAKQTTQPVLREQRVYLLSVIVLCIKKRDLIIMVLMYFVSFERTDIIQISNKTFYYTDF